MVEVSLSTGGRLLPGQTLLQATGSGGTTPCVTNTWRKRNMRDLCCHCSQVTSHRCNNITLITPSSGALGLLISRIRLLKSERLLQSRKELISSSAFSAPWKCFRPSTASLQQGIMGRGLQQWSPTFLSSQTGQDLEILQWGQEGVR